MDAPNQKMEDLWSIPHNHECGELKLRNWTRYFRKYRQLLRRVQDWSESSEICHLLRDILPSWRKKRVDDEEKKQAKRLIAVRIMSPEDQHPPIVEYFRQTVGELDRMISMKNSVYVEVVRDTAGGRLLRLNNIEWGRGEKLRMQMIPARMTLDAIVQYLSVALKLNSKRKAHIEDRLAQWESRSPGGLELSRNPRRTNRRQRLKSKSRIPGWKDVVRRGVYDSGRSSRCTLLRVRGLQQESVWS